MLTFYQNQSLSIQNTENAEEISKLKTFTEKTPNNLNLANKKLTLDTEELESVTAAFNEAIASVTSLKSQLDSTISKSERLETTLLEVTADTVTNTDSLKSAEEKIGIEFEDYICELEGKSVQISKCRNWKKSTVFESLLEDQKSQNTKISTLSLW